MSDGTFRPSGATAWSAYNTPRIWAMVENEDDPESWRQVAALGSMAGLLNDQRKRLELARDALIQAWPPEQNKAAATFVDMIDDLLFNMAENRKIADSNAAALSQVLEALRQAKAKVEPLYRSYLEKNDDWVPGWWDHAEDELDEKAREQMRGAERIIAQSENSIVAPDIYEFKPRKYVGDPIGDPGDTGSGTGVTPFAAGGSGGGGANISVPHDPPPSLPESGSPGSGGRPGGTDFSSEPSGPSLAGVITPTLPGLPPPVAAPSIASPPVSGTSLAPATPGLIIGAPGATGGRSPFGGGQRGLPGSVSGGGLPGRPSSPTTKPATPSWLPPPSGQPASRGSAGQAGRGRPSPTSMLPGPTMSGPRRNGERGQDVPFDPDNPWATAEGVAPVIEPSRVQYRHDPGPGVIGWRQ